MELIHTRSAAGTAVATNGFLTDHHLRSTSGIVAATKGPLKGLHPSLYLSDVRVCDAQHPVEERS